MLQLSGMSKAWTHGKRVLAFALAIGGLALTGCGADDGHKTTLPPPGGPAGAGSGYREMVWDTNGGGDLHFKLTPTNDPNNFQILVTGYNFQQNVNFTLSLPVEEGWLFDFVKAIMNGSVQVGGGSAPGGNGAPTGSWTTIRLNSGSGASVTVTDALVLYDLDELYYYVMDQLP